MWVYHSPVGDFFIRNSGRRYDLICNDTCYGSYPSGVAAADDVSTFNTGYDEWDALIDSVIPPTDIHEWEKC